MTICIAAITDSNQWPMIVAACDRKVSFGNWDSAQGAMKISGLNKDWSVMFSGSVSAMTAMVDAIMERTKRLRPTGLRPFARLCRQVYLSERKPLLESDVLGDYDIYNYAEYTALRKSDPTFHQEVTKKIREAEQDWNLLFAGFDKNKRAHIFTITECGRIDFSPDRIGFAAIGSGAPRAQVSLSAYPFKKNLPLSHALFSVASAKFSAESAEGVGEETILTILEADTKVSGVLPDYLIPSLRQMWRDLPRFPGKAAEDEIWKQLHLLQDFGWLKRPELSGQK